MAATIVPQKTAIVSQRQRTQSHPWALEARRGDHEHRRRQHRGRAARPQGPRSGRRGMLQGGEPPARAHQHRCHSCVRNETSETKKQKKKRCSRPVQMHGFRLCNARSPLSMLLRIDLYTQTHCASLTRIRRCLFPVLLAAFVADGCIRAHQRRSSGVRLRRRPAETRACGECKNATATYGVVGDSGGSGNGWTRLLCRKCAHSTAAGERKGEKVLRLAGRCTRCRMFAIYGAAPGLRTHCRCQSPCHRLPPLSLASSKLLVFKILLDVSLIISLFGCSHAQVAHACALFSAQHAKVLRETCKQTYYGTHGNLKALARMHAFMGGATRREQQANWRA